MDDRLKILIIDDDDVDRMMVRRALKASGLGAEFAEAADGKTGVKELVEARDGRNGGAFDCVLLDYRLPDMDGREVLKAARGAGVATPVILLTGQGDEALAVELMKAGANDYLSKQRMSRDLLSHSVRHAVRLHRAQSEADRARVQTVESEQRFRLMADSAPVLLWVSDHDGRLVWFNQAWLDFTGRDPATEKGCGWVEGVHPDDLARVRACDAAAAGSRERFQVEFRLRRFDGVYRWVLETAAPRFGPDGSFAGYVGSCVDITDRKAAEQERAELLKREQTARAAAEAAKAGAEAAKSAAEESERRYRFLAEAIPQIVFTADADGNPDYFNQRWLDYTGLTAEQGLADGWLRFVHPDDLPSCLKGWDAARAEGRSFECEYRLRRRDGAWRWHLGRAEPMRDSAGAVVKWLGTCTDIDDRRQFEDALRVSRERLDLVVEASALGLWYCDLPFDKLVWNERCKEHFGLPPDADVSINTFYRHIYPQDREHTLKAIDRAIKEKTRYDTVYRTVGDDGRLRWVRAIGRAFYDAAGVPTRFDGITVDVTSQKQSEQELKDAKESADAARESAEAANAAKDQFLAVLSHELRTPLTPVLSTVQAMEAEPDIPPALRESVEMIKRNVELEARLIDDLLDLTRISKNKLELDLQTVDVHETLQSALAICRGDLLDKGLKLETDLSATRYHVRADPARLHQVFWNLVKNAVKFTPAGGTVFVRTRNVESREAGREAGSRGVGRWGGRAVGGNGEGPTPTSLPPHIPTAPLSSPLPTGC